MAGIGNVFHSNYGNDINGQQFCLHMTSADVTEEIVCNMHNHYWKNVLKESCDERARAGEIKDFTGISSPYEAPADPELVIETDKLTMEESVAKVMQLLRIRGIKEQ